MCCLYDAFRDAFFVGCLLRIWQPNKDGGKERIACLKVCSFRLKCWTAVMMSACTELNIPDSASVEHKSVYSGALGEVRGAEQSSRGESGCLVSGPVLLWHCPLPMNPSPRNKAEGLYYLLLDEWGCTFNCITNPVSKAYWHGTDPVYFNTVRPT